MVGFRQKIERAAGSERSRSPPKVGQHSLTKWLNGWAWGNVPASEMVREAHAYVQDHGRQQVDTNIMKLARTHSSMQNAERVVESILPLDGMPEPMRLADSIIDSVLLPFDLFRWLRITSPAKFETHLGAKAGGVEEWWARFKAQPKGQEMWDIHPWLMGKSPSDLKKHLPLMLFDDAGPVSNTSSSFVRCWYSLLGGGSERHTRFLTATGIKGDDPTPDRSWSEIMGSFEKLAGAVDGDEWGGRVAFHGCRPGLCLQRLRVAALQREPVLHRLQGECV